jgi:LysM domain
MTALSIAEAGYSAVTKPQIVVPRQRAGSSAIRGAARTAPRRAATSRGATSQTVTPDRIMAPRRPRAAPASPGPVRLTRRGRIVVGGLAIAIAATAVCLLSLSLAGGALASSSGAARAGYQGMRHVVIEPGQTLWSIAAAADPAADPRLVIEQIIETNSLAGATVYAGEQLWVPA